MTDQEICINLKKLYDETESKIRTNAMVSRAFIDKISTNVINDKVNAQLNSIKTGIYNINPKFKDGLWKKLSTKELMVLNCGVGEDSWESLGLQGDPTSPF